MGDEYLHVVRKPYLGGADLFKMTPKGARHFRVKLAGGYTPAHIAAVVPDPEGLGSMKIALRGSSDKATRTAYADIKADLGKPKFRSSTFRVGAVQAVDMPTPHGATQVPRRARLTRSMLERALANAEKSTGPFTRVSRSRLVKTRNVRTGEETIRTRRNTLRWDTGTKSLATRGLNLVKNVGRLGSKALGVGQIAHTGKLIGAAKRASKKKGSWLDRFTSFGYEAHGMKLTEPDVRKTLKNQI
jgi:hypothetical protein